MAETHNVDYQPDGAVKMFYAGWTVRQNLVVDTEPAELDGCGSVTAKISRRTNRLFTPHTLGLFWRRKPVMSGLELGVGLAWIANFSAAGGLFVCEQL